MPVCNYERTFVATVTSNKLCACASRKKNGGGGGAHSAND